MRNPWISSFWALAALSTAKAAQHEVKVGSDGLTFDPETLTAKKGDVITYTFHSGNHSVTQSTFDSPCAPLEGGFSSGYIPVSDTSSASPLSFRIILNHTDPVYAYSAEKDACQKGMLHVINPARDDELDALREQNVDETSEVVDDTPRGGQRILRIEVGKGGKLEFEPEEVGGQVSGTLVQFHFNPGNYSVVQGSYDNPCQPLKDGFSSGFIPIGKEAPEVDFTVTLNDTEPVYFYDAQRDGSHCQSGMVGSINALTQAKTHSTYHQRSLAAPPSTIPPYAPQAGVLTIGSSPLFSMHGNILRLSVLNSSLLGPNMPSSDKIPAQIALQAGGPPLQPPESPAKVSKTTGEFLQLLQFLDNILIEMLVYGYERLNEGEWKGIFPETIVEAFRAMTAQSYIHRSTPTTALRESEMHVPGPCAYRLPLATVDTFVSAALTLLSLEIGLITGFLGSESGLGRLSGKDAWLMAGLVGSFGAKTRQAGLLNMMQDHPASGAVAEVGIPGDLVYSYLDAHYIALCSGEDSLSKQRKALPRLGMVAEEKTADGNRVTSVRLEFEETGKYVAWLGAYGEVRFTEIKDGKADVPSELYGVVWGVVTKEKEVSVEEIIGVGVAGPEMLWVGQP